MSSANFANVVRTIFMVSVALTGTACLFESNTVGTRLAGRTIKFNPPAGYCVLDERRPQEREAIETLREIQKPMNHLIWIFADCQELNDMREGRADRVFHYGEVMAIQPEGTLKPVRTSRFQFAFAVTSTLPRFDQATVTRELNRRTTRLGLSNYEVLHFGHVSTDPSGAYAGIVVAENWGRARSTTAGVVAMTLVRSLPMSIALYGPYSDFRAYETLRTELRPIVGDFITLNEYFAEPFKLTAADRAGEVSWANRIDWIDWESVLLSGLAAAVVPAVLLLLLRIWRKAAQF